jgi:hypothetical protein
MLPVLRATLEALERVVDQYDGDTIHTYVVAAVAS